MTSYKLKGDVLYVHKRSAPTLLLSLGRTLTKLEGDGLSTEAVTFYPSDHGWSAMVVVQDPNDPTLPDRDRGLRVLGEDESEADMGGEG